MKYTYILNIYCIYIYIYIIITFISCADAIYQCIALMHYINFNTSYIIYIFTSKICCTLYSYSAPIRSINAQC